MREIKLKGESLTEWEHEARVRRGTCSVDVGIIVDTLLDGEPVVVCDRTTLEFVLWASELPGWPGAVAISEVERVVADRGAEIPAELRDAIDEMIEFFDVDETGMVEAAHIDALRPFRA